MPLSTSKYSDGPAIKAQGLRKSYGSFVALDGLDMEVPPGSVYGLLGPNGAGKTTAIKILLGICHPSAGSATMLGLDLFLDRRSIMRQVGAIVEAPVFYEYLSAKENLLNISRLSGEVSKKQVAMALETVGLEDVANKRVGAFSFGMKQRLGIALTLLPDNKLVFLDEPTNGLDPHGIAGVRRLIRRLTEERGITIFLSSHLLSEVEQVCDHVAIIDKGVKICEGDLATLVGESAVELEAQEGPALEAALQDAPAAIIERASNNGRASIRFKATDLMAPAINRHFVSKDIEVFRIGSKRKTLEDIFVEHTGQSAGNSLSDRF